MDRSGTGLRHDTVVLQDPGGWRRTDVLVPTDPAIHAGWYSDPYDPAGLRYWDGRMWTSHAAPRGWYPQRPARRRSLLVAFVLALFFGGLALPYALPLPGWARLLIAGGLVLVLGWWTLLFVPLTWPFALVLVPALTALLNPRR